MALKEDKEAGETAAAEAAQQAAAEQKQASEANAKKEGEVGRLSDQLITRQIHHTFCQKYPVRFDRWRAECSTVEPGLRSSWSIWMINTARLLGQR